MKKNILLAVTVLVLFSCDEAIQLDFQQVPPRIVIEGLVTDRPGYQFVKISKSVDFYTSGKTPRVTDAAVRVTDDLGNEYLFVHNPRNHADSMGIYLPEDPFTGAIGRTYTLRVQAGEALYEATDKLVSITPIDSLSYRLNEDEADDPKEEGKVYELLLYAREPQDETNFYLFKFFRNDTLKYYDETDIYLSDDKFLTEDLNGVTWSVYYGIRDTARMEAFSITRVGFVYYNDLSSLLNNDAGGMFGSVPVTPRTNLSNGALGFFQVSAVSSSEEIVIE
jgi:hypothetical protein